MIRLASFFALTGVILGALGAHGPVHDVVASHDRLATWDTAVLYQLVHALALLALGIARVSPANGAALCFVAGMTVFSGSLYVLSLTNVGWIGAITPIGGLFLMAGWLWLIVRPPKLYLPNS